MINQLRVGQLITPTRIINSTMVSNWRYASECGSVRGGLMPGAELKIVEISVVPGAMWVRVELPGREPKDWLKIAGGEFSGNFQLAASSRGNDERALFESSIQALEAELANAAAHVGIDTSVRKSYVIQIRQMSDGLKQQAISGRISWSQAAAEAHAVRNEILSLIRIRSTPLGRAFAERLKREGKSLNELVARKAVQIHGPGVDFKRLSAAQKNAVFAEIVKSAGRSNTIVTAGAVKISYAGRVLIVMSLALSIYSVMSAEDKLDAAAREATLLGGGIAGGLAGGALAGLACGPGAPVCVTVGAFVGGALAAFGVDMSW